MLNRSFCKSTSALFFVQWTLKSNAAGIATLSISVCKKHSRWDQYVRLIEQREGRRSHELILNGFLCITCHWDIPILISPCIWTPNLEIILKLVNTIAMTVCKSWISILTGFLMFVTSRQVFKAKISWMQVLHWSLKGSQS